jgi:hypothetical protein
MTFSTGMHYLDLGIGAALLFGVFWWMYTLTSRSYAQSRLERATKQGARQPWDNDRAGRRGNR